MRLLNRIAGDVEKYIRKTLDQSGNCRSGQVVLFPPANHTGTSADLSSPSPFWPSLCLTAGYEIVIVPTAARVASTSCARFSTEPLKTRGISLLPKTVSAFHHPISNCDAHH